MHPVLDENPPLRGAGGVAGEGGTGEVDVPRPTRFGVGRGVDPEVSATALDVGLECGLLGGVEHISGGGEEDDGLVLREVGLGERRGVFGGVDGEVVVRREPVDRRDAGIDAGGVPEARGLGEEQDLVVLRYVPGMSCQRGG